MNTPHWQRLESVLARDPGGRGLAGQNVEGSPLGAGALAGAAHSLAGSSAHAVAIVTGFSVRFHDRWVPETDGPPGALLLAHTLSALGSEVAILSDSCNAEALRAGCRHLDLPAEVVEEMPLDETPTQSSPPRACQWADAWLAGPFGGRLTHLVAIERVGPSHTAASIAAHGPGDAEILQRFEAEVEPAHRNVCHNMRGESIDHVTARADALFELVAQQLPDVVTIGIGDGGNEIGMGSFAWDLLRKLIPVQGGRIACRIPTQHTLVAGVSNWGGYALAAALCRLRDRDDLLDALTGPALDRLIAVLVDAGCIDAVRGRAVPTVDGLPPGTEAAILEELVAIAK